MIFWIVMLCSLETARCFRGTHCPYLQGERVSKHEIRRSRQLAFLLLLDSCLANFSTLTTKAVCSSKLHSTTSQKTVFFTVTMRTSNPTKLIRSWDFCSVWFLTVIHNFHGSQLTKIYDIKYFKWFITGDWAKECSTWIGCKILYWSKMATKVLHKFYHLL